MSETTATTSKTPEPQSVTTVLELHEVIKTLEMAQNIVGREAPIKINIAVRAHFEGDRSGWGIDTVSIGKKGKKVEFGDVVNLVKLIQQRADDIGKDMSYEDRRSKTHTFIFEGFYPSQDPEILYDVAWGT